VAGGAGYPSLAIRLGSNICLDAASSRENNCVRVPDRLRRDERLRRNVIDYLPYRVQERKIKFAMGIPLPPPSSPRPPILANNPISANSTNSNVPGLTGTYSTDVKDTNNGPGIGVHGTGEIGVRGTSYAGRGIYGESTSSEAVYGVSQSTTSSAVHGVSSGFDGVVGETSSPAHAGITGRNTSASPGPYSCGVYGVGGLYAGKFDGNLLVNGNVLVSGDVILINTPTSGDIAEDFDIDDDEVNSEPGTVLIINAEGRLCASSLPYDTRVAGVVSGAGNLKPAVVLQRVTSAMPRSPIALLGKAFCKVDATFGSIAAGDLLTTSPTRGYAMKVSDKSQALGAVIGKALTCFKGGCGLIPIMVSLR
jgi:hypothetical protein